MLVAPFAMAAEWNASTCSGESHVNPIVEPLAGHAGSPFMGSVIQNTDPLCA
ncbi:hypothetical protein JCM19237_1998 [Photobacterium aphoticum]|uniref:Uncharacterized protein n=1 Tax=Photobacterium aphoticum TaxID=754436 RepID=A0A090R8A8_9GAMM|nr:hypothetical protein JCM19237_1998 [Photobacterium aphoticum]